MKVNEQVLALLQRLETCITSLDNSMEDIHIKLDALDDRLDKLQAQVLEVYDNTRGYDSAIEGVHDDINEIKALIPAVENVLDDARRAERVGWAKSTKPAF